MEFRVSDELNHEIKKIKKRDKKLYVKIEKQLFLFKQNNKHPSLRLHKLTGDQTGIWSMSIDKNMRMLFIVIDDEAHFFDLGTHDEVYRSK